jgi:hypothetical protein
MQRDYDQKISVVMSKAFFEAHKDEAAQLYRKEFENEERDKDGYYFEFDTQTQELSIDKNTLDMTTNDRPGNWFSFRWKVNNDMYAYLAELCVKKLNKLRALLEAAA